MLLRECARGARKTRRPASREQHPLGGARRLNSKLPEALDSSVNADWPMIASIERSRSARANNRVEVTS
jgi:hypothetical protein